MVSNVILSDIESFNKIFLEVIDLVVDYDQIKLISSVLISPNTGEFFMQMNVENMSTLKQFALSEDFRKYRHLTLSESVLLCPLKDKDKLNGEDFEFFIAIYDKGQKLIGLIYVSVDKKDQASAISQMNNRANMMLLSNTIKMMCEKYAVYNRLFFSVNSYMEILSVKDKNMPFHTTNVANLCLKLAKKTKLNVKETVNLYIAALLHDIGKLYIPDDILNNKKKYSYHEYEMVKSHSVKSAEMAKAEISNIPVLKNVPKIIKYHHERFDGGGYPEGLTGEEIPKLSRYLMLADSVDAMLTHRFYKKQKNRNLVMKELHECSGTQFDPKLIPFMIDILKESRNKYDIASVVGTNYIHNVALTYFYESIDQIVTVNGSMVMQKNKAKFMLNKPFEHDTRKIEGAKICFFYLNDIFEYNVHVHRHIGDQLILDQFNFEPLEEQFSIPWRMDTTMYYSKGKRWDAKVIKIGGSSCVLEIPKKYSDEVLTQRKKVLQIPIQLKVESFSEFVELEARLMQYFDFGDKHIAVAKYLGVKDNRKEFLIRGLFKKQILDRKSF